MSQIKKGDIMKRLLLTLLVLILIGGAYGYGYLQSASDIYQIRPGGYETTAPDLPQLTDDSINVLVFSKTDGFRHIGAIPAAKTLFSRFGVERGWTVIFTDNAAVHNPDQLSKFDLVVWNSVTGDVLTEDQRTAFMTYIENGGSYLALHGSGGTRNYKWDDYPDVLIGARFTGHPMGPQFREATLIVEDRTHPSTAHLPESFMHLEEWYSFEKSPRGRVNVLATVNEADYQPENRTMLEDLTGAGELAMGSDHPVIWHHKVGQGTVYFTALGHRGDTYADADYQKLLEEASLWLIDQNKLR